MAGRDMNDSTLTLPDTPSRLTINDPVLKLITYTYSDIVLHPEITMPIIDLINAAFSIHVRFRNLRLEGHSQLCEEFSEDGSFLLTLYSERIVVAAGVIKPTDVPGDCKLLLLATSPSFSRAGYGSLLLSHAESLAYENGYKKVTLEIVKEHDGVLPFYTKRAYKVVREVKRPDESGNWRECESWGPKAPFTLCVLEKELGG